MKEIEIFKNLNSELKMSSKEIAELTERRHDNVIRDIKNMLSKLYPNNEANYEEQDKNSPEYERHTREQYKYLKPSTLDRVLDKFQDNSDLSHLDFVEIKDPRGYTSEYLLDKDLTLTLISGYSIPLRHKIIKRWQELEKTKILSPAEQLLENAKMLVAIEKKQQEHELKLKQIEQLAIQANSYNSANTGFMTIRGFCNIHKIKQSMREAIQKGKEASALAKEYSIITKKAKDEMFGEVNVYPVELLEEVFGI